MLFTHTTQASKAEFALVLQQFKTLVEGHPEPFKASSLVRGFVSTLSIDSSVCAPLETLAAITGEHSQLTTMEKGPFKNEKVRLAKAINSKCALMESMLNSSSNSFKFLESIGVDAEMFSKVTLKLKDIVALTESVRDDDVKQASEKLAKAIKDYTAWQDKVPDVQLAEKDFVKFIRNSKLGITKGASLSTGIQSARESINKIIQEWNFTVAEKLDQFFTEGDDATTNMRAIASINAVLSIVRNPLISSTEGAELRTMLEEVMKEFDEESLAGMCPSSLREDADKILSMGQKDKQPAKGDEKGGMGKKGDEKKDKDKKDKGKKEKNDKAADSSVKKKRARDDDKGEATP